MIKIKKQLPVAISITGFLVWFIGQMFWQYIPCIGNYSEESAWNFYHSCVAFALFASFFANSFQNSSSMTSTGMIIVSGCAELAFSNLLDEIIGTPTKWEINELIGFAIVIILTFLRVWGSKYNRTAWVQFCHTWVYCFFAWLWKLSSFVIFKMWQFVCLVSSKICP